MYTILLVDDDVPMLKYMSKRLAWNKLELEIVGIAHSGERALHLFRQTMPDLLLTDIGMPGMDGLELAAEVRRIKPETKVIFLTCHEDFHYAKKAVQLDASDYLIKDDLTDEALRESLKKAVSEHKETLQQRGEWSYKQDVIKNKELLKQRFFEQIIQSSSAQGLQDYGKRLGIEWPHSHFMMAAGHIRFTGFPKQYNYADVPLLLYAICNIAEELSSAKKLVHSFLDGELNFICVMNYQPNLSHNYQRGFHEFIEELTIRIKQYLKLDISYVVGKPFEGMNQMRSEYKRLLAQSYSSFYGEAPSSGKTFSIDVQGALGEEWELLLKAFKERDELLVRERVERMRQTAAKCRIEPIAWEIKCSQWLRMFELDVDEPSEEEYHHCLLHAKTAADLEALLVYKSIELMHRVQLKSSNKKPKMHLIDQYISEHLSETISLVDIAEYLFLNPSYVSRYFKQETGMNFTDYVHKYKMRVACHLLKSKSDNIELIGLKLGYSDRTYFSKIFKKYVGVNPKDYR
ncbi:response regulator transcription factor [Paenibacillus roseipurpureus]|uniref:Response regulator n=1 Tax=Paenibacillus roseopurpureus TaxID=2918901 RepID=A0AA96LPW6_9BACL|nr:response regulator [Paenibacillus sp. MBLB1832]WNR46082.1 response regulator [Paenibacillus sp. MBLB1832]